MIGFSGILFSNMLLPYFLYILAVCIRDDKMGATLCLQIRSGQVLTHYAQTKQLNTTDKDHDTDSRRPACHRITKDQPSEHDQDQQKK